MICYLSIENFVLVKSLKLEFGKGLQVLTGETGAGKSVIVGAIDLIFGGQVHSGMVLNESKPVYLELAVTELEKNAKLRNLIEKYEIDDSEKEIFFSREIKSDRRSRSFINGRRVARDIVKEFREALLDFHSQRDQQKLFNPEYQLEILDKFGKLISKRNEFQKKYKELSEKIDELRKLQKEENENREKMQLYQYQIEEIEAAQLKLNEDSKIQDELEVLDNAEEILNNSAEMEQQIYEQEDSIYDVLSKFASSMENYKLNSTQKAASYLQDALANLDDAIYEIRDLQNKIDLDSSYKEKLEKRLDELNSLKAKYKKNIPEIIEYLKGIKKKLDNFDSEEKKIKDLEETIKKELEKLDMLASELSEKRKKAALKLSKLLEENIQKLAIPHASINIKFDKINEEKKRISSLSAYSEFGYDKIEFKFSANKGVSVQPLQNVASGGETSRVLLAIKKILSQDLEPHTIIFDEIDTGIGGRTSELLGNFIAKIAKNHQVLCITHLAPIASFANEHFSIEKKSKAKLAEIWVKKLTHNERKDEIARMISGSKTELALKYAEEILKKGEDNDNG
ncbi:MAG: DNA repair protein RecN [Candidatus Cloacimonadota bacterium]|nr:DNA repair protein RecN [Candidatus Cloacimonadota bacterium]